MVLMARVSAGSWADTTTFTANPRKTAKWFLYGAGIALFVNMLRYREAGNGGKADYYHR
jgi:hypothetical protein